MAKINAVSLAGALIGNILVASLLIRFAWIGNDKAFLVSIFYYFILIILNIIAWQIFEFYKRPGGRIYKVTTTVLVILTLPFCIASLIH